MPEGLLPLFPLQLVLLPGARVPLHIFEPRYREMVGEATKNGSEFGIVLVHNGKAESTGCTAIVERVTERYDDGRFDVDTRGVRRFEAKSLDNSKAYLQAAVDYFDDEPGSPVTREECEQLYDLTRQAAGLAGVSLDEELDPADPWPSFRAAGMLPLDMEFKQKLLTLRSERQRLHDLKEYLEAWVSRTVETSRAKSIAQTNGHARKL